MSKMNRKILAIGLGFLGTLSVISIFVQENKEPAIDSDEDIETLAMKALSKCLTLSSDEPEYSFCFNEKINLLESKFPSIRTDLKKMGFVFGYNSSDVKNFSNVSSNQQ